MRDEVLSDRSVGLIGSGGEKYVRTTRNGNGAFVPRDLGAPSVIMNTNVLDKRAQAMGEFRGNIRAEWATRLGGGVMVNCGTFNAHAAKIMSQTCTWG